MRATVTAGTRHSGPRHIPPAQLQQDWLIKHHGIFLPKSKKKETNINSYQIWRSYNSRTSSQKIVARTEGKQKESINLTWQHSHRPVRQSQPGDHRLSRGHPRQVPAQKAAQQQDWVNIFTNVYAMTKKCLKWTLNKWLKRSNVSLKNSSPWSWQCTLLVPRTGPAHPEGCLHQHRSGWPPQSGPSSPNHHRDLHHTWNQ